MNSPKLQALLQFSPDNSQSNEEQFSIPLDISDLLNLCRTYSYLGWQNQQQIETILEMGVEEAIDSGIVKVGSLHAIKSFLRSINENSLFGDASHQALECLHLIELWEHQNPLKLCVGSN